jgi:YhcH/YjgK/YiaL family protein
MILDHLAQAGTYTALSARFEQAFAFLNRIKDGHPLGRHDIAGDEVFALVQHYTTQPVAEKQFEAHRRYLDIQYILRGREFMYWAPLAKLTTITQPYDASKDAARFALIPDAVAVPVTAGQFTIFYPADGHIPCCAWDGQSSEVTKVVVKVLV